MNRRAFLQAAAGLAAATGMPLALAQQQLYRFWVGFPPGGSGDTFARLIADQLRPELGNIVIENREGAGGLVAAQQFLRAPADGYNVMMHTASSAVFAPVVRKNPPYDPMRDFQWVALMSTAPLVVVANPKLPVASLKTFMDSLRGPTEQAYGSAGIGASTHLAAELLLDRAGVKALHVPYKGSAPALIDTISGRVTFMLETLQTTIKHHSAGTLKIIAVLGESRIASAPDIPTAREQGIDVLASTYNLMALPVAAPPERAAALAKALAGAMGNAEFRQRLATQGLEAETDMSPARARAFVAAEVARWAPVARRLNIEL